MSKKRKRPPDNCRDVFIDNPVVSATDCTGIAVTVPEEGCEAEALCDIYPVPNTARNADTEQIHKKAR